MEDLVIVDGYNFIFNFYKANAISNIDLSNLRDKLIKDLSELRHYAGFQVIVVFDAKYGEKATSSCKKTGGIEVIYSKSGETADTIVEKLAGNKSGFSRIFVVTSDYTQQKVVFKDNIYRKSVREFALEMKNFKKNITKKIEGNPVASANSFYLFENRINGKIRKKFNEIRMKK